MDVVKANKKFCLLIIANNKLILFFGVYKPIKHMLPYFFIKLDYN